MKTLLAWLDWSTYCRKHDGEAYTFPVSICPLFWRTLLSLAALPFTWITHIWNALFVSNEAFRNEETRDHKMHLLGTVIITVLTVVAAMFVHDATDGKDGAGGWGWDWFHMTDPLLLTYVKMIGAGLLGILIILIVVGIAIGIIYLIWLAATSIRDSVTNSKEDSKGNYIPASERAIPKAIHAIKNKYCPKIDWSKVRKK